MAPRTKRKETQSPPAFGIELHTELSDVFSYEYRRLRVERAGRRAGVRELVFRLDYDCDRLLVTKPQRLVRQQGRSLAPSECDALWEAITACGGLSGLKDSYPCLDDLDPADLDATAVDGVPVAVLTGEEGRACLTLREGREQDAERRVRRIVIDRCSREPRPEVRTPLASLLRRLRAELRAARPFTYRRGRGHADLLETFERLRAVDFLNLREFERRFVEALGLLGDPSALPLLLSELFASDPLVRLEALEALAAIGCEAARPDVELLCYDDDPQVRERARSVLERLGRVETV